MRDGQGRRQAVLVTGRTGDGQSERQAGQETGSLGGQEE